MQDRTDIKDKEPLMISKETRTGLRMTGIHHAVILVCLYIIVVTCILYSYLSVLCALFRSEICGGASQVFINKDSWSRICINGASVSGPTGSIFWTSADELWT